MGIGGTAATFSTVSVERGAVDLCNITLMVQKQESTEDQLILSRIRFIIDPPKGNSRARRNELIPYVTAEFSGRTFLRQNYAANMIFDDISDSFTGIAKTYTNKVSGLNTVSDPGNGILFINGVFQAPTTEKCWSELYLRE